MLPPAGPYLPVTLETMHAAWGAWLEARVHSSLALTQGGLEIWVAIDVAGWLNRAHGSMPSRHWDIERDVPIYTDPDLQVGLLLNRRAARPEFPLLAIGVRAQSMLAPAAQFRQGVEAELARLKDAPRLPEFARVERHLLAVAMDPDGASAITPLGFSRRAVLPSGPAVLWWSAREAPEGAR